MTLVWPYKVQSCHARCVLLVAGRHGDFDITARCSCHCGPSMLIFKTKHRTDHQSLKALKGILPQDALFYKGHLEVSDTSAMIPKAYIPFLIGFPKPSTLLAASSTCFDSTNPTRSTLEKQRSICLLILTPLPTLNSYCRATIMSNPNSDRATFSISVVDNW